MALLFMDGFDLYTSIADVAKRGWGGGNFGSIAQSPRVSVSSGKSINSLQSGINTLGIPGAPATTIVGMGINHNGGFGLRFTDPLTNSNAVQVLAAFDASGFLSVSRVNSSITTTFVYSSTTQLFKPSVWNFIELKTFSHATSGTIEIRVNNSTVCSLGGVNTAASGVARLAQFGFGGASSSITFIDDFYMLDTSGSRLNDFLGDCRIDPQAPNSDISISGWTRSVGSTDFSAVNKSFLVSTPNLSAANSGALDSFGIVPLGSTPVTVHAVQATLAALRTDTGPASLRANIKSGATTQTGSAYTPGTSSLYQSEIAALNPNTSAVWSASAVNSLQLQIERAS